MRARASTSEGSASVVELMEVSKTYGKRGKLLGAARGEVVALDRVSFSLRRGEIFGLVGESGSGKTTAGRLIVRLEEPDSGRILLDGQDTEGLKGAARRGFCRKVQMIFQDPYQSLNPHLSVFDTIVEPLTIHRIGDARAAGERVREVMASVGLAPPEDFGHRYPHQLSGGQRQRVAIARAMVLEPKFVVADEPTSMLDASISAQIFKILLAMRERFGVTILFITHNLAAARYLCDRIGVIYRGRLVEVGPAEEVIQAPKHPYTRALIGALPAFGREGVSRSAADIPRHGPAIGRAACGFFPLCGEADPRLCALKRPTLEGSEPEHRVACFRAGGEV